MIITPEKSEVYKRLEQGIHTALEAYSNVHRGSGHNALATTHLFEQARDIVLEHLGLAKGKYIVIFSTPRRTTGILKKIDPKNYLILSSHDLGLSLGVRALAVRKGALPKGIPFETGGGTARLVSPDWVVWAKAPDRFEAGTPAIINIIAFARALRLTRKFGKNVFRDTRIEKLTANEILYQDRLEAYTGQELIGELRKTLIGRNRKVPTTENTKTFINFDNSASTPTFEPIWNTFRQTLGQDIRVQHDILREVRSISAKQLNAPKSAYDIIYTSNTTEAINLAADNISREFGNETETVILNTLLEHSSNDLPWRVLPNTSLIRLTEVTDGLVDLKELETILSAYNREEKHGKKKIRLVALSAASNVLGACNNLAEISRIVHQYGAKLLVDAAQLMAHRKIDMIASDIDYLAFSAHKVYAPFGCGMLVTRKGLLNFSPVELAQIQASGEENVAGIAALGKALVLMQRIGMEVVEKEEQVLTERALKAMAQIPGLKVHGINSPDHPEFNLKLGVIVFEMKGLMADKIAKKLSMQSAIGVRYGCHCAHIIIKDLLKIKPGLEKFQRIIVTLFPKLQLPGMTRISFGLENTNEEIDQLIIALEKINAGKKKSAATPTVPSLTKAEFRKQMKDYIDQVSSGVYSIVE